ncbi:MAG: ribosome maturation factor RimM [Bacteroidia bacterium]
MFHPKEYLRVGTILKPHGHQGAVKVTAAAAVLDFLKSAIEQGNRFVFIEIMKKPVPFFMESLTMAGEETAILKWEDVDSPEDALKLRSHALMLPIHDLPMELQQQPENFDLEGFALFNLNGDELGIIEEVMENSLHSLIKVKVEAGKELLLPLHEDFIVETDVENKRITANYPDDLLNLNNTGTDPI